MWTSLPVQTQSTRTQEPEHAIDDLCLPVQCAYVAALLRPASRSDMRCVSRAAANGTISTGAIYKGVITNGAIINGAIDGGAITNPAIGNGSITNATLVNGTFPIVIITRRYGPLHGLLLAPKEGFSLRPMFFFDLREKKKTYYAVLADFRPYLVSSSNLSNF